jgi:hypothetical protein
MSYRQQPTGNAAVHYTRRSAKLASRQIPPLDFNRFSHPLPPQIVRKSQRIKIPPKAEPPKESQHLCRLV